MLKQLIYLLGLLFWFYIFLVSLKKVDFYFNLKVSACDELSREIFYEIIILTNVYFLTKEMFCNKSSKDT